MGRFEYKYLVPEERLADLRAAIRPFVEKDGFTRSGDDDYSVHSIYFDTRAFDYYREKVEGIQHRKKVRLRGYNEQHGDTWLFLEIKRKNDRTVWKNRAPFLFRDAAALFATQDIERYIIAKKAGSHDDARRFFYQMHRHALSPVINIHYTREAFFCKFNRSLRITFDRELRSNIQPLPHDLFDERGIRRSLPGYFIVEVKFSDSAPGVPRWLGNILGGFGLQRVSVSKYTVCLDAHGIHECSAIRKRLAGTSPLYRN